MKKVIVMLALMFFSSSIFAQNEAAERQHSDITISKHSDKQKCPDYLDCTTGEIKYFEYKQDFTIDSPEVCGPLGISACVLQKGVYEVDRTSKNGATIVMSCKPFQCPQPKSFRIAGRTLKDKACISDGNACWANDAATTANSPKNQITVTAVLENGSCVALRLTYPPNNSGRGVDPKAPGY